ncbi:hypothetical protein [Acinetobacter junii]|uniref:hypothetical protein n=1 Tax=Acinetobacter junii TaxID=40215 RepID=UPI003AF8A546
MGEGQITSSRADEILNLNDDLTNIDNQASEGLADSIIDKLFDDERFKALLTEIKASKTENNLGLSNSGKREKRRERPYKPLRDLIVENNKKLKSSINMHQPLREYLEIIETLYKEFEVEYDDFPLTRLSRRPRFKNIADLYVKYDPHETLMRLEVFMLALLFKPVPVFMNASSQSKQQAKETLKQCENRITQLGRELLFVLENVDDIKQFTGNYFSRNIQILAEFFKFEVEQKRGKNALYDLNYDLSEDALCNLNRLLCRLKAFAESGNLRTDKNLFRLRDGDTESRIIKPSHLEVTKKWTQNSERLKKAVQYFHGYKKQDIALYRFRLEIAYKNCKDRVPYEQFQKFFTSLNKKAAKPEGFSGYLNYLYFWRENFVTGQLVQDIIIVFNANSLMETKIQESDAEVRFRDIPTEFLAYICDLLKASSESFNGMEVKLNFESVPILQNPEWKMPAELIIEAGDKEKWSFFEKRVLPYFIFLETFDVDYTDDITTRFSRGHKAVKNC